MLEPLKRVVRNTGNKKYLLPSLARVTAFVFIWTNVAFAHQPLGQMWRQRRRQRDLQMASLPVPFLPSVPSSVSSGFSIAQNERREELARFEKTGFSLTGIPTDVLGHLRIRGVHRGRSSRTVFVIEDVHQNKEAQTHISGALKSFGAQKGEHPVRVGLEGSSGKFLYKEAWRFPDHAVVQRVADSFLESGEFSGPAHAGFTSVPTPGTRGLTFWGVDDPVYYRRNVAAYRRASHQKETMARLDALERENVKRKEAVFGRSLLDFDRWVTAYRNENVSLGAHLKKLAAMGAPMSLAVDTFLEAYRTEQTLDFDRVEAERRRVLEQLVKRIPEPELKALIDWSLAYQQGEIRFSTYYGQLKKLCEQAGIDLARTPEFNAYVQYVMLSEGVSAEALMGEVKRLEQVVYHNLAERDEERKLIAESDQLYRMKELSRFSLTSDQWKDYKAGRPLFLSDIDLSAFEAFYVAAQKRDQAMAANITRFFGPDSNLAVLVVGGFHTAGLTTQLRKRGLSYVVASPKMTAIDDESPENYLSIFDRERTPLETLFSGRKLFVVATHAGAADRPDPTIPDATPSFAQSVLTLTAAKMRHASVRSLSAFGDLVGFVPKSVTVVAKKAKAVIRYQSPKGRVTTYVNQDPNAIDKWTSKTVEARRIGQTSLLTLVRPTILAASVAGAVGFGGLLAGIIQNAIDSGFAATFTAWVGASVAVLPILMTGTIGGAGWVPKKGKKNGQNSDTDDIDITSIDAFKDLEEAGPTDPEKEEEEEAKEGDFELNNEPSYGPEEIFLPPDDVASDTERTKGSSQANSTFFVGIAAFLSGLLNLDRSEFLTFAEEGPFPNWVVLLGLAAISIFFFFLAWVFGAFKKEGDSGAENNNRGRKDKKNRTGFLHSDLGLAIGVLVMFLGSFGYIETGRFLYLFLISFGLALPAFLSGKKRPSRLSDESDPSIHTRSLAVTGVGVFASGLLYLTSMPAVPFAVDDLLAFGVIAGLALLLLAVPFVFAWFHNPDVFINKEDEGNGVDDDSGIDLGGYIPDSGVAIEYFPDDDPTGLDLNGPNGISRDGGAPTSQQSDPRMGAADTETALLLAGIGFILAGGIAYALTNAGPYFFIFALGILMILLGLNKTEEPTPSNKQYISTVRKVLRTRSEKASPKKPSGQGSVNASAVNVLLIIVAAVWLGVGVSSAAVAVTLALFAVTILIAAPKMKTRAVGGRDSTGPDLVGALSGTVGLEKAFSPSDSKEDARRRYAASWLKTYSQTRLAAADRSFEAVFRRRISKYPEGDVVGTHLMVNEVPEKFEDDINRIRVILTLIKNHPDLQLDLVVDVFGPEDLTGEQRRRIDALLKAAPPGRVAVDWNGDKPLTEGGLYYEDAMVDAVLSHAAAGSLTAWRKIRQRNTAEGHVELITRAPSRFWASETLRKLWVVITNLGRGWRAVESETIEDMIEESQIARFQA